MSTFYYKKAAKVTKRPTKVTFHYKMAAKVAKRTTGLSRIRTIPPQPSLTQSAHQDPICPRRVTGSKSKDPFCL